MGNFGATNFREESCRKIETKTIEEKGGYKIRIKVLRGGQDGIRLKKYQSTFPE